MFNKRHSVRLHYFLLFSSGSPWLKSCPWGLRKNLAFIKDNYNDPDIYITENGFSDKSGTTDDQDRIDHYNGYINNVLKGISQQDENIHRIYFSNPG